MDAPPYLLIGRGQVRLPRRMIELRKSDDTTQRLPARLKLDTAQEKLCRRKLSIIMSHADGVQLRL